MSGTKIVIAGLVSIGMALCLLYAPCLTGGCAMVHTVVSTEISAPPQLLAALYADYEGWPRLFPATIRGVRLLADDGQHKTIEVDHATEGKVINIMMVVSPHEIRLEEFKRRFDARFINRFEAAGQETRYSIVADVRLKGVARALAPLAPPIVRARLNRFVLEPMRAAVESRRQLTKFLVITSLGMFVGNLWILVRSMFSKASSYPQQTVAHLGEIPVGGVKLFTYPTKDDHCILVRTSQNEHVSYSQKCTHLSCAVYYSQALLSKLGSDDL